MVRREASFGRKEGKEETGEGGEKEEKGSSSLEAGKLRETCNVWRPGRPAHQADEVGRF